MHSIPSTYKDPREYLNFSCVRPPQEIERQRNKGAQGRLECSCVWFIKGKTSRARTGACPFLAISIAMLSEELRETMLFWNDREFIEKKKIGKW